MENQVNTKSIILNNGLYLGLTGVLVGLILYATGSAIELQWINTIVSIVATVAFIILGIKKYKEENGGYISWGQGVKVGMGIAMVSGIIAVIYTLLFTNVIAPEFQQQAMEVQQKAWLDAGMTEEQIESAAEMTQKFQTPGILTAVILASAAFFGFIISAIVAAVMKKSEEENY
ncbi:DUF4199 domain-containing protein [Polaribacter septentrionalilitoris]|uniref:DUF4199 domain-containing protein n=1 Tax=Polaribacter septentrionalilitoris TaxID=2494657 RepID=UPI00135924CE|nr:DUF4199 domain-containing protein [Polaribacter septentrionalilitoris]